MKINDTSLAFHVEYDIISTVVFAGISMVAANLRGNHYIIITVIKIAFLSSIRSKRDFRVCGVWIACCVFPHASVTWHSSFEFGAIPSSCGCGCCCFIVFILNENLIPILPGGGEECFLFVRGECGFGGAFDSGGGTEVYGYEIVLRGFYWGNFFSTRC